MATLAVMSEPEEFVALQIPVRKQTRKRLKQAAAGTDLTMAELGDILLEYGVSLLESRKVPQPLRAAIEAREAARREANDGNGSAAG
jgi:hypothetical protein